MPTPPLPLLHQLLKALHIPVLPPCLDATPPSLLLVILENILGTRLPLRHPIRLCQTTEDELAVVKCILGVLADDILGIDLSVIDPVKVVQGSEQEMAVMVMALVVVAKRNGIVIKIPSSPLADYHRTDTEDILDAEDEDIDTNPHSLSQLPAPILPDISYPALTSSSPVQSPSTDVFDPKYALTNAWNARTASPTDLDALHNPSTSYDDATLTSEDYDSYIKASSPVIVNDRYDVRQQQPHLTDYHNRFSSVSSADTQRSGKTILHQMLEEFGLDPHG